MLSSFTLRTEKEGFYDITHAVREAVEKSGTAAGLCVVYCPHTTAGITMFTPVEAPSRHTMFHGGEATVPSTLRSQAGGIRRSGPDRAVQGQTGTA